MRKHDLTNKKKMAKKTTMTFIEQPQRATQQTREHCEHSETLETNNFNILIFIHLSSIKISLAMFTRTKV